MCRGKIKTEVKIRRSLFEAGISHLAGQEVTFDVNDVKSVVKNSEESVVLVNVCTGEGQKHTIGLGVIEGINESDQREIEDITTTALQDPKQ